MSKRIYLTELSTFAQCPLAWWKRYVEHPEERIDNANMAFGRAVHRAIACAVTGGDAAAVACEVRTERALLAEDKMEKAAALADQGLSYCTAGGWPERSWEYDGFGGIVDLWEPSISRITDWKTGTWRSPRAAEDMSFYAWGTAGQLGLTEVKARLIYLESGKVTTWTFSRDDLRPVGAWARLLRERMLAMREDSSAPQPTKCAFCRLCKECERDVVEST